MKPQSFATLAALLRVGSGLVIGQDKVYLLETRLAAILKDQGLRDLDALADCVHPSRPGLLERRIIEAMTTNESFFFRDEKPFAHFRTHALPRLHATRAASAKLRIWSAASSAGQEAYSLAMILAETRAQMNSRGTEILGTDISREQTQRAKEGVAYFSIASISGSIRFQAPELGSINSKWPVPAMSMTCATSPAARALAE